MRNGRGAWNLLFSASQRAALLDAVFHLTEKQRPQQDRSHWCGARLDLVRALVANSQGSEAERVLDNLQFVVGDTSIGKAERHVQGEILVLKGKISHMAGRFREAEQFYIKGLKTQQEVQGEDSFSASRTLSQLAIVQQVSSTYALALLLICADHLWVHMVHQTGKFMFRNSHRFPK